MLNKLLGRNKSQEPKREQTRWESFRSLLGVVLLAFIIRTYFYGLYQVPTPSMENTMLVGERFFLKVPSAVKL
jgi:signal peptidase I